MVVIEFVKVKFWLFSNLKIRNFDILEFFVKMLKCYFIGGMFLSKGIDFFKIIFVIKKVYLF